MAQSVETMMVGRVVRLLDCDDGYLEPHYVVYLVGFFSLVAVSASLVVVASVL